ncbi:MAG: hypothetical protein QOG03_2528 [Actinomycetota bacterium]|jgi:hypothetical protein|nr:hypothetical protein [Actinomycetota bacterium]
MTMASLLQALVITAAGLAPFVLYRRTPAVVRVNAVPRRRPTP